MKKLGIFFVMFLFLSACSVRLSSPEDYVEDGNNLKNDVSGENDVSEKNDILEEIPIEEIPLRSDSCRFLTWTQWQGTSLYYSHVLSFGTDGSYKHIMDNETYFDNGINTPYYRYKASENTFYVFDTEKKLVDKGRIIYVDEEYLVIDFLGECFAYFAHDDHDLEHPHDILHESARKYVLGVWGINQVTKPLLHIEGYGEGTISVSQYVYESEEASDAKVWELNLSEDCEFKLVVYAVDSDTAEETLLEKSDYENVSAEYADGFFAFNDDGEVSNVIFYSEID